MTGITPEGLKEIVSISRYYGRDPEWVVAGGGNASWKDDVTMWIKASGTSLGEATKDTFVAIDRKRLARTWDKTYPTDPDQREREALEDLLAARFPGESGRPSVETGMHEAMPHPYVFHTHPTVINGVTCSQDGEKAAPELFGDDILWIPSINPGYVLSKRILDETVDFRRCYKKDASVVLMENHGLTLGGNTPEEIHRLQRDLLGAVLQRVDRQPLLGGVDVDLAAADDVRRSIVGGWQRVTGTAPVVLFDATEEALFRAESPVAFQPLERPFSPDHIVYAGHRFLYLEKKGEVSERVVAYATSEGVPPKIVLVRGLGAFAVGRGQRAAETARMLFRDALKVAAYAESFGGARGMPEKEIDFIRNWEVERFRAQVSVGDDPGRDDT